MLGFGDSADKAPEAAPEVAATVSETPVETVSAPAESVQKTDEVAESSESEPGVSASVEEQVDEIFADLDTLVHGSSEEMNAQQNELLSAKIKVKRLLA